MKQHNLVYFFIIFIVINSCKKDEDESLGQIPPNYRTFEFQSNYSGGYIPNRLIVRLNEKGLLDSITDTHNSSPIQIRSVQKFYYSGSTRIDSSVIEKPETSGYQEKVLETYSYNEVGSIQSIYRYRLLYSSLYPDEIQYDTIELDYDNLNRIISITTKYSRINGQSWTTREFIYNDQNNLKKAIYKSSPSYVYPHNYENLYEGFDNNINPLNQLCTQCNYPLYVSAYSYFSKEYAVSKNNSISMQIHLNGMTEVEQSYSYNPFGYPDKVISDWNKYNLEIFYTN